MRLGSHVLALARQTRRLPPIALLLGGLCACGPATSGPTTPTAPGAPAVGPGGGAVVANPDLPPAAEPQDIVLAARWKNPMATFASATSCAGLPPGVLSDQMFRKVALEGFFRDAIPGLGDPAALAQLVALDAPVDAVATLDSGDKKRRSRKPLIAFSIGLTSLERAKQVAGASAEIGQGMWRIGAKKRRDLTCAVAAASGAPARLVCGPDERDVVALGPYLARNMARVAPPANDLHAELRLRPVEARHGGELKQVLAGLPLIAQGELGTGDKKFDDALVQAATAVGEEVGFLLSDLDKVSIDLGITPSTCLTAASALELRGKKSWVAGTIADRPERAGPPPPIFWRLPKDSDGASFARGVDPARFAPMLRALRALADGALAKNNVGAPADRKALVDLITIPVGKDVLVTWASGHSPPTQQKTGAKLTDQQLADVLFDASLGWNLIGYEDTPANVAKYVKDFVSVYNRAGLLGRVRKELGNDAKYLPTVKSVGAPKQLGANAQAYEIKFSDLGGGIGSVGAQAPEPGGKARGAGPDPKAKPKKAVTALGHILVMADGNTTWVAFGMNRDELVKRLLAVKSGAPEATTLSTRPGLETLKTAKLMSGGFMSVASFSKSAGGGFWALASSANMAQNQAELAQMTNLLTGLPHKGETPIVFASTVSGGGAPRAQVTVNMPKGAVEDVAKLATNAFGIMGKRP